MISHHGGAPAAQAARVAKEEMELEAALDAAKQPRMAQKLLDVQRT